MTKGTKHKNYEILNLIGYGLAKFDIGFVKQFGFKTKSAFFDYIVKCEIAETTGTVKNRQDLFDPFFDNGRKGWWQKGDAYIHRKVFIDSLFGSENLKEYSNIVKLFLKGKYKLPQDVQETPVLKSKFKQLQLTGNEAELYFMKNYRQVKLFNNGILEDARLYGDGYDFQVEVKPIFYLAEVKGVRESYGSIRMTKNEYQKAGEYTNDYILVVISNLNDLPKMNCIENPAKNLKFKKHETSSVQIHYHTQSLNW